MRQNSKYNLSKTLTFLILSKWQHEYGYGMPASMISSETGVSLASITTKLPKWVEWGYLKRKACGNYGKPCYAYSITQKGMDFLSKLKSGRVFYCLNLIDLQKVQRYEALKNSGVNSSPVLATSP